MCAGVVFVLAALLAGAIGSSVRETVDESQTGDLNVQVSLKNVEIIAMLSGGEQYTDYDYNYDYAEMTIKPPNSTNSSTAAPSDLTLNSSLAPPQPDTTTQTVVEITPKNPALDTSSTQSPSPSTAVHASSSQSADSNQPHIASSVSVPPSTDQVSSTVGTSSETTLGVKISEATELPAGVAPATAEDCRKGFHRNKKGECELKLKPSSTNALLKLVELSQKLKLRRAN